MDENAKKYLEKILLVYETNIPKWDDSIKKINDSMQQMKHRLKTEELERDEMQSSVDDLRNILNKG